MPRMSPEARAYRRAQRARYPRNWKRISRSVITRAEYRCEACGAEQGKPHPVSGSKVILGAAHLDHRPENVSPDNLRAWCQRCHLRYDHPQHLAQIRANRLARLAAAPPGGLLALMLSAPPDLGP
jgi:5-methylcytosine-specific restriction endonuclease McrA